MKLERANTKKPKIGGWVLYGYPPKTEKWFERWYKTKEAAMAYGAKRSWNVTFQP